MSTAQTKQASASTNTTSELDKLLSRSVKYTPFAEQEEIELSFGQVKNFISAKTKSGKLPNDQDIVKFMMLCKARELNPWVGDAYLVGYDTNDGPCFSLITAIQALFKRAEANPAFDGIQSGVIVRDKEGNIVEREGDFTQNGEQLVGSWAKVYRSDRKVPFYDSLKLGTYNKGFGQWKNDPEGMIVKCAEASALRKAFPSQLSGLYVSQEADAIKAGGEIRDAANRAQARTLSDLAAAINANPVATVREEEAVAADPLDAILEQIIRAKDEAALTKIYDAAIGPDATADLDDNQRRQVEAARADRLAVLREGAK